MGLEVFWRESAPVEGHTFAGDCYGEKSTKVLTDFIKWIPLDISMFFTQFVTSKKKYKGLGARITAKPPFPP